MNIVELNQKEVAVISGGSIGCFLFTVGAKITTVAAALYAFKIGKQLCQHQYPHLPGRAEVKGDFIASTVLVGVVMFGSFVGGNTVVVFQSIFGGGETKKGR